MDSTEVGNKIVVIFYIVVEIIFFVFLGLVIFKDRKEKKKIKQSFYRPGMEDLKHFYRPLLKKYGIKVDDKYHERN